MKRRGFLKVLVAAPVAALPVPALTPKIVRHVHVAKALAPPISDGVVLNSVAHPTNRLMTEADWSGVRGDLEQLFSAAYAEHPVDWVEAFGQDDIDAEALEDIEIDLVGLE